MPTVVAEYPIEVAKEFTQGFVPAYFGDIDLGHKARNQCFTRVAQQISRHPGGTLPDKLSNTADYHAMDRLMNRSETTHERVLAAHRERTLAKMQADESIRAWTVRVWEESAPSSGTKLEWILVCLDPVVNAAEAWEKCDWYSCRWMVEEFHKAKKTGCGIENLQFRTEAALQPMIAMLSVVAVMLLNLRQAARRPDAKERPAIEVVEPIYEEVLRDWRYKTDRGPMSVYEFYMAVARLGGHMNRKADGFPGWLTLWRGWQKLQHMVTGVEIERRRRRKIV